MDATPTPPPAAPLATAPAPPREDPAGAEAAAALLQAFAQVPALSKAWAFPAADGVRVSLQLSQRDLPGNAQRKLLTSFALNEAALELGEADTALPLELRDASMVAPAPSGRRTLVVRPGGGAGEKESGCVLEVWGRAGVTLAVEVPSKLHGAVYNDGWFGAGAAWSPDEGLVAYVAEGAPEVRTPEWGGRAKGPDGGAKEGAGPKGWRGVGEFEEDW
jgi:acylaminoacyl-peptidase